MSNITVTGGGGYIGSLLVPLLLSKGHCVTVIDSFMFSQSSLLDCCADKKLTVIRGDVRDGECIKRAIDGAEPSPGDAGRARARLYARSPIRA